MGYRFALHVGAALVASGACAHVATATQDWLLAFVLALLALVNAGAAFHVVISDSEV